MASGPGQRLDKGFGCYFCAAFANDASCGPLDPTFEEAEGFSKSTIADFIRAAKPSLFRELKGLPISSTDLIDLGTRDSVMITRATQHVDYQRDPYHDTQIMLDLQHKRYIQIRVLNGYDLTLRKLIVPSLVLPCSDPRCAKDTSVIPTSSFFLTLSKDMLDPSGGVIKKSVLHYSLTCLEDLFDRGLCSGTPHEIDGHFDTPTEQATTEFPYHFPSNSPEARRLRSERQDEIREMVQMTPVKARSSARKEKSPETPNLKLARPSDVSPYVRRYKKQGLTWQTRGKNKLSEQNVSSSLQKSRTSQETLICYCREPADGSELVYCSSPACMIGQFHLRCLQLNEPLEEGDEVYCAYCAEDLTPDCSSESESDLSPRIHPDDWDESQSIPTSPTPEAQDSIITVNRAEESRGSEHEMDYNADTASSPGFVAVNSPAAVKDASDFAQFDGTHSDLPATPYLKPTSTSSHTIKTKREKKRARVSPQPGSSEVSFADLAPFISVSHLTHSPLGLMNNEARIFMHWKRLCPSSKLLQTGLIKEHAKRGQEPGEDGSLMIEHGSEKENGVARNKLSEMLKIVSEEGNIA